MILGKNGTDCHDAGHNRTENRRDCGSGDLQPGEAKVSADQKIVEHHVYQVTLVRMAIFVFPAPLWAALITMVIMLNIMPPMIMRK